MGREAGWNRRLFGRGGGAVTRVRDEGCRARVPRRRGNEPEWAAALHATKCIPDPTRREGT